jgi:predicted N-formylglutamate amidohydrolase
MSEIADFIAGEAGQVLLIADHASNHVPADIKLGIAGALLHEHIAVDIGVEPLTRLIALRLGCPAVLAQVSRLVVDLHRREDEANLIPALSDGHDIPGNAALSDADRQARIDRFWRPYHAFIEERIDALAPRLLVALHSFTPRLTTKPGEQRPWQVGILYNQDDRAARIAIGLLRDAGIATGDNEPYSGKQLNATMDRHAERRGLPYLAVEVRQDLLAAATGPEVWADRLAPIIVATLERLAPAPRLHQMT